MDLKRGIDKAVAEVVKSLQGQSQEVGDDNQKIQQVASISANDKEIGKMKKENVVKFTKSKKVCSTFLHYALGRRYSCAKRKR